MLRPRRKPNVVLCKQGLPAALDGLTKLVGTLPTLSVWQSCLLTALSAAPSESTAAAMLASPSTAALGTILLDPALAMPAALSRSSNAAASGAAPDEKLPGLAASQQLPASKSPATHGHVVSNSAAAVPGTSQPGTDVPAVPTSQAVSCKPQAASQQPVHTIPAQAAAVTVHAKTFKDCVDLAEMILQKWPAEMHLQSPMHGTTFSRLVCRLGLPNLAVRVLAELQVGPCRYSS